MRKLDRARTMGADIHLAIWRELLGNVHKSWPRWFVERVARKRIHMRGDLG